MTAAIDTRVLVRAHDPITSISAAESAAMFSGGHCDRILSALRGRALTAHELQSATGLTVVQVGGEDLVRGGARVWEAV